MLGLAIYYLYPKYRKRALSNLALATDLNLTNEQIIQLAKSSMQNLAICFLEYPRLYAEKDIESIAYCKNPEVADAIIKKQKKGVIFFGGHQANWEVMFLELTARIRGVAIGRPIANHYLYAWVLRLREKFGGTIIPSKDAYRQGAKVLKEGKYLGIIGDQGMPDSGFCSSFLGRQAWTSPLPALLSKRTGAPIIVTTIHREQGKYIIHYSDPIEPQEDIKSQMKEVLALFEASVKARPHEWLWIHNRWKQQRVGRLKKEFRYDSIALIFGPDCSAIDWLHKIREVYPLEQLTAFIPEGLVAPPVCEIKTYRQLSDILVTDYRFKLVIDFNQTPKVYQHFKRLSAFYVFQFSHPKEMIKHACPSLLC